MAGSEAWRLSPAEVAQFERDGFLVIRKHASAEECDVLVARAKEIAALHNVARDGAGTFETASRTDRSRDAYFLGSAYTMRVFFEPGVSPLAAEQSDESGSLSRVNKIGHALHELDPQFEAFSCSNKVQQVVHSLGLTSAVIPQSMFIVKAPRIGGAVNVHRDCTFLRTEPRNTCLGLWWALEPATRDNGCLWVLPGSHVDPNSGERIADLQFVRVCASGKKGEYNAELDRTEMRGSAKHADSDVADAGWVALECEKGDLVLIDGSVLHKSAPNTSERSRCAYSIHVFNDTESSRWSDSNWLQRDPRAPRFRAL
ncbi:Phytanoyl-CoA dioxygenase domain-containing protein 1-like [Porphyridium purpureum]|uniref:Phytanoyl-CoA dioxygenase domain-containing protein 1-like n=1 Tax=Porphyridium purpureum TaxID=35688 RepID=A0A5J4Z8R9_PORPP|nr:Phytanoyl-CoA dioxygenase domain-containing protein 1-like [Porphyridium purpureum]|eukprot:POR7166..scf295_1